MKLNFRKIVSALTSAVMIGSTVAMAANFPDPFVSSGQADVAIVYGASAAASDMTAATSIQTSLANTLSSQASASTTTVTVGEGEKYKIEKSSDMFNLGDEIDELKSSVDEDELPTLLGEGVYKADDNEEYEFSQKVTFSGGLELKHFQNDDYGDAPVIGFEIESATEILNYTLDFTTSVESDVASGDLEDIEQTTLSLLGKEYFVLNADNGTNVKLTLLDSASTANLKEGETKQITVDGKVYDVSVDIYSSTQAKVKVGTETTDALAESDTYKLADGTYVGIKEILYSEKETGVSSVELSLGSGKLVIENGEEVELNSEDVEGINGFITMGTASGGKEKLESIKLQWKSDDDTFVTPAQSLTMPGFEAIKLILGGMNFDMEEEVELKNSGSDNVRLRVPVVDGIADIEILHGNGSASGKFDYLGKDSSHKLVTSASTELIINTTNDEEYFVASYATSTEGESFYLKVTKVDQDSNGKNFTTIKNELGDSYEVEQGDTLEKFGDVILTINTAEEYGSTNDGVVNLTINTNGAFNKVYSEGGLLIYLPVDSESDTSTMGRINLTANPTSYTVYMVESDKDDDLAEGGWINATVNLNSDGETTVSSVTSVWSSGSSMKETGDNTDVYEGFVKSDLASQVLHDTGGDQDTLKVMYHGAEAYADVYVASPSVGTGAGSLLGNVIVKDSEAASMSSKNLVVVGGSCINTVAASMLGSSTPMCGAAFTAATGVGVNQALIKVAASPLASDKIAMLVAGYEAEDTLKAATYLTAEKPSTASGTEVKLNTASTTATVM